MRAFTLIELLALRLRSGPAGPAVSKAFSLVELLVVITIIAILLAMLTPALDQAVYQAELTVCGAKLKGIAAGLVEGAVERNRVYPSRTVLNAPLSINGVYAPDERPVLRSYLNSSLNGLMNCPLSQAVDVEAPIEEATVTVSYNLWYGWSTGVAEKRMQKIGDRWTWDDRQFGVIASDSEYYAAENVSIYGSHPDRENRMINYIVESETQATSIWGKTGVDRGLLDLNHAFEDGGVQRYANVPSHEPAAGDGPSDERLQDVPLIWQAGDSSGTDSWSRVPRGG